MGQALQEALHSAEVSGGPQAAAAPTVKAKAMPRRPTTLGAAAAAAAALAAAAAEASPPAVVLAPGAPLALPSAGARVWRALG
eukprot:3717890-Alexandrium_andersonii.AAC.1